VKRRTGIGLAVVAAGLAIVGLVRGCGRPGPAAAAVLSVPVVEGPLAITVKGSGDVRSRVSNKIIPPIKRSATITLLVPEGTRVASNDVVARFNPEDAQRRVQDLDAQLGDNEVSLNAAENGLEIQKMDNTTATKKAEQGLAAAQMELDKFLQGDEPLDRRNAELRVQTSIGELDRKEKRLEELGGLLKEGFVTEDEVDEARLEVGSAKVALETARIEKQLLEQYSLPLKRAGLENALAQARSELEKTRRQNEVQLQGKAQQVENARRTRDRTAVDLGNARKEIEALDVRATSEGVVVYGDPDQQWRRGEITVGAQVQPGQVLMTIPDVGGLIAVVNIPEADIHDVRTGQTAQITVDALPGRAFPAVVTKVAEVANSEGWWSSDVKQFRVELDLKDGQALKPGFSSEAEITVQQLERAVYVPVRAVFREGDQYCVYPDGGGSPNRVSVKVGRSSALYVQILDGVGPGVRLRLSPAETPPASAKAPATAPAKVPAPAKDRPGKRR
jgi:HlyD family secretion protein